MNTTEVIGRLCGSASAIPDDIESLSKRVSLETLLTLYNTLKNLSGVRWMKPGNRKSIEKALKVSAEV